jgi:hypothetical protein
MPDYSHVVTECDLHFKRKVCVKKDCEKVMARDLNIALSVEMTHRVDDQLGGSLLTGGEVVVRGLKIGWWI